LARGLAGALLLAAPLAAGAHDDSFPALVERVKAAVVGIGTYQATRRPPNDLRGTGFAIGDGRLVATNAHVVDMELDETHRERLAVFVGHGRSPSRRAARILARDDRHDLALLEIAGAPVPALSLSQPALPPEGTAIAFTGFPLGAVLGLHPVTHRGIVSAHTPIIEPAVDTREISASDIKFLRDPYEVLQLDTIAYPGNSGSPLYRVADGTVVGVINKVFVKGTKEDALSRPSAITYAIPVRYLRDLLAQARE